MEINFQTSDKFQGLCLEQVDGAGAAFIEYYDIMPPGARELLKNSPFNLCTACVTQEAHDIAWRKYRSDSPKYFDFREAIQSIENTIRRQEYALRCDGEGS